MVITRTLRRGVYRAFEKEEEDYDVAEIGHAVPRSRGDEFVDALRRVLLKVRIWAAATCVL